MLRTYENLLHIPIAVFFTLTLWSGVAPAEPYSGQLDIDTAVGLAQTNAAAMRLADVNTQSKKELLVAAERGGRPVLSADATVLYGSGEPTSFFAAQLISEPGESPLLVTEGSYVSGTLSLTVPIYQQGALFNYHSPAVRLAEGAYGKARWDQAAQAAETSYQVATTFINASAAGKIAELQHNAREKKSRRLRYISSRVEARLATRSDELLASAALAFSEADLNAATRKYDFLQRQLATLVGLERAALPPLVELAEDPPAPPPVESFIREINESQPDIRSQEAAVMMARADLAGVRSESLPTLSLNASSTASRNPDESDSLLFRSAWLRLSMPLLDFGQSSRKVSARRLELQASQERLRLTQEAANEDVYAAYFSLLDAGDKAKATQVSARQAQYQEQQSIARHSSGILGLDTLIQDEAASLTARIEMIKSRSAVWQAYAELQKTVGKTFTTAMPVGLP
jgi:outer membrane protein TolC